MQRQERQLYTLTKRMTEAEYIEWLRDSIKDAWATEGFLGYAQLRNALGWHLDLEALLGTEVLIRYELADVYKMPSDPSFVGAWEELDCVRIDLLCAADREYRRGRSPKEVEAELQGRWDEAAARAKSHVPEAQHHLLFATKIRTSAL